MDYTRFNAAEQQQIQSLIEQQQVKDFLRLYSGMVERCFDDCVNDFTSKSLASKEEQCVSKCADKFLKHYERVGARFAEMNQQIMNEGLPKSS